MGDITNLIVRVLRFAYRKTGLIKEKTFKYDLTSDYLSNRIFELIQSENSFLIARIGAVEFNCIAGFLGEINGFKKYWLYILGKIDSYEISSEVINQASNNAGIFPKSKRIIEQFAKQSLDDLKEVDILGVWLKEENLLAKEIKHTLKIPLAEIEPYYHERPWSAALKGKKVLVIHPFTESIKKQFLKREVLFTNPNTLPEFELLTIKAVQTITGQKSDFNNWFEALDHMKGQMDDLDYDIAIIGCGAYGLSLGAHAKRMGKQAIHMGGATQILFGIKGARWDNHPFISKLYNENWVRPSNEETPGKKDAVEDGCYW